MTEELKDKLWSSLKTDKERIEYIEAGGLRDIETLPSLAFPGLEDDIIGLLDFRANNSNKKFTRDLNDLFRMAKRKPNLDGIYPLPMGKVCGFDMHLTKEIKIMFDKDYSYRWDHDNDEQRYSISVLVQVPVVSGFRILVSRNLSYRMCGLIIRFLNLIVGKDGEWKDE